MRPTSFRSPDPAGAARGRDGRRAFCHEPWAGVLAVEVDRSVTFCPCYLKLRLGSLDERSLEELWNAAPLVAIRRAFAAGRLAPACRGQLCPPALGTESYLTEIPEA